MEGLIFDIKRMALNDGPGLRTTLFFKGCPLACWWCHNPEGIRTTIESFRANEPLDGEPVHVQRFIGEYINAADLIEIVKKEKPFMDQGGGGITLSGGEPLMQPQFAKTILQLCNQLGIHTAIDTCGAVSYESIAMVLPYTDLFLYDIKFIQQDLHLKYTHAKNDTIMKNFKLLVQQAKKVVVRIPLIPGLNTTRTEQSLMLEYLNPLKCIVFNEIHFLPYHKLAVSKYRRFDYPFKMQELTPLKKETVEKFAAPFTDAGFNVVIHNHN